MNTMNLTRAMTMCRLALTPCTNSWKSVYALPLTSGVFRVQNRRNFGIISLPVQGSLLPILKPKTPRQASRSYSGAAPMTLDLITKRVLLVLQLFDKVDPTKLKVSSHFKDDLGLDSLDHVEVIMAIEDEFYFEIPDAHAERLLRPSDIIQYVGDKFDIYE